MVDEVRERHAIVQGPARPCSQDDERRTLAVDEIRHQRQRQRRVEYSAYPNPNFLNQRASHQMN